MIQRSIEHKPEGRNAYNVPEARPHVRAVNSDGESTVTLQIGLGPDQVFPVSMTDSRTGQRVEMELDLEQAEKVHMLLLSFVHRAKGGFLP